MIKQESEEMPILLQKYNKQKNGDKAMSKSIYEPQTQKGELGGLTTQQKSELKLQILELNLNQQNRRERTECSEGLARCKTEFSNESLLMTGQKGKMWTELTPIDWDKTAQKQKVMDRKAIKQQMEELVN